MSGQMDTTSAAEAVAGSDLAGLLAEALGLKPEPIRDDTPWQQSYRGGKEPSGRWALNMVHRWADFDQRIWLQYNPTPTEEEDGGSVYQPWSLTVEPPPFDGYTWQVSFNGQGVASAATALSVVACWLTAPAGAETAEGGAG